MHTAYTELASYFVETSVNKLEGTEESRGPTGRGCSCFTDPVLETIGVPALFATQVNEVVRGSGRILRGHVPHDAERVTGHLTDLDVARCGERGIHFCHLQLEVEINVNLET